MRAGRRAVALAVALGAASGAAVVAGPAAVGEGVPPALRAAILAGRPAAEALKVLAVLGDARAAAPFAARPGGGLTGTGLTGTGQIAPGPPPAAGMQAALGRALFEKLWVPAPSSTRGSDGLGPMFNARACAQCHPGGGRARPESGFGRVARLAVPGPGGAPAPDPQLGAQLQTRAAGMPPEGRLEIEWQAGQQVALPGGPVVTLRRPVPRIAGAAPRPGRAAALRIGPALAGAGLIEAVPEAEIRARADPADADGDGISGRPGRAAGGALGRFGWKATEAGLEAQIATALAEDMGLSSPLRPLAQGDCPTPACAAAPHGETPGLRDGREVPAAALAAMADHLAALPLAPRRGAVPEGEARFAAAGCPSCHVPRMVTGARAGPGLRLRPGTAFELIWPHSDFLLHDMGPGLADPAAMAPRTGPGAGAAEWRTAPLWGLGAALRAAREAGQAPALLHDGRAGSLEEAILWHGGEAAPARARFAAMPPPERAALIAYLESL